MKSYFESVRELFIRRLAAWIFWETSIPLGPLGPYILGLSLGSRPHRVRENDND